MGENPLKKAKLLLNLHRFPEVIALLEPLVIDYRESFSFHYILGTACLYLGDIGGAEMYYRRARNLKMMNADIITAQAVLYLRRGEIQKAVEHYLEAQEYEPGNTLAQKALNFIKHNSNPETVIQYVKSGKIKRFYPSLGISTRILRPLAITGLWLCFACGLAAAVFFILKPMISLPQKRADLSAFVLSIDEKKNALEQDSASSVFRLILNQNDLERAYGDAQTYFQKYRDNAAQVEINRILNSNASASIRQKARLLMNYLTEPGFDTIKDNYTYMQVQETPWLYQDCWVVWSGRITNTEITVSEYRCDFLIGYDTMKKVDGIAPLVLKQPVTIDTSMPIRVLARVNLLNGKLLLEGKSVYQPIREN